MKTRDIVEVGTSLITGVGLGAAVMYLLDPDLGEQRRQHVRETAGDAVESAKGSLHSTLHHVSDRSHGWRDRLSQAYHDLRDEASNLNPRDWRDRLSHAYNDLRSDVADRSSHSRSLARDHANELMSRGRKLIRTHLPVQKKTNPTTIALAAIGAAALGAGLMYMMDPTAGRRRRHLVRDKAQQFGSEASRRVAGKSKHYGNVARGYAHEVRSAVGNATDVVGRAADVIRSKLTITGSISQADTDLAGRVRSEIEPILSPGGEVCITASNGKIRLTGSVVEADRNVLEQLVSEVAGVQSVQNDLQITSPAMPSMSSD